MTCRTIAVANQKGGTAKTATALSLGVALARTGGRVLLVDADPQGDLTDVADVADVATGFWTNLREGQARLPEPDGRHVAQR